MENWSNTFEKELNFFFCSFFSLCGGAGSSGGSL